MYTLTIYFIVLNVYVEFVLIVRTLYSTLYPTCLNQCGSTTLVWGLPDPHPDLLVRGTDPRIRIRIRFSTNSG
jgi:hypothetical protein